METISDYYDKKMSNSKSHIPEHEDGDTQNPRGGFGV